MVPTTKIARTQRYRRHLEGADFSLEANTEAVPEAGHFYILRAGEVLLRSNDLAVAEATYQSLCREFWESQLDSADPRVRRMSALGLLGQDPQHTAAAAVIRDEGSPADKTRLDRAASTRRYQERTQASRASRQS